MAILVFWDSAGRLHELMKARCSGIDLDAGTWLVPAEHRKGGTEDRLYALHPQTIDLVRKRLAFGSEGRLWPYPSGRRTVWLHLKAILIRAGLPHDRKRMFHCFRRSSESHAAAAIGVNRAAEAVGHSPEIARKHYIAPSILPTDALCDHLPRIDGPGCPGSQGEPTPATAKAPRTPMIGAAVEALLRTPAGLEMSNQSIAAAVGGCDDKYVGRIRSRLERAYAIPRVTVRRMSNGSLYPIKPYTPRPRKPKTLAGKASAAVKAGFASLFGFPRKPR